VNCVFSLLGGVILLVPADRGYDLIAIFRVVHGERRQRISERVHVVLGEDLLALQGALFLGVPGYGREGLLLARGGGFRQVGGSYRRRVLGNGGREQKREN
jgi:hypothetical protein